MGHCVRFSRILQTMMLTLITLLTYVSVEITYSTAIWWSRNVGVLTLVDETGIN